MRRLLVCTIALFALMACSPKATENTAEQPTPAAEQNTTPKNHAEYASPDTAAQQEVFDFIQKKGVFYIATMDGNQPRVRPFGA